MRREAVARRKSMNTLRASVSVCGLIGLLAGPAGAVTIIDTTNGEWNEGSEAYLWGEGDQSVVETFGQTFTVNGPETILTRFTFWINDYYLIPPDAPIDFGAYIAAWNGARAIGPVLYQSGRRTTTNNHGRFGEELFTFETGGVPLAAGMQYVAFLSASEYFDGLASRGGVGGFTADSYSGGCFVSEDNGSDFSVLFSENWTTWNGSELAFQAELTPEPAALLLLGLGGLAVTRRRFV
jgi:hypothetical protein